MGCKAGGRRRRRPVPPLPLPWGRAHSRANEAHRPLRPATGARNELWSCAGRLLLRRRGATRWAGRGSVTLQSGRRGSDWMGLGGGGAVGRRSHPRHHMQAPGPRPHRWGATTEALKACATTMAAAGGCSAVAPPGRWLPPLRAAATSWTRCRERNARECRRPRGPIRDVVPPSCPHAPARAPGPPQTGWIGAASRAPTFAPATRPSSELARLPAPLSRRSPPARRLACSWQVSSCVCSIHKLLWASDRPPQRLPAALPPSPQPLRG